MTDAFAAPQFLAAGDGAMVVQFGAVIDPAVNARVTALAEALRGAAIDGVIDLVPTFRSLMIHYDPLRVGHMALRDHVTAGLSVSGTRAARRRAWVVPCCYEGDHAPDLAAVAAGTGLSPAEVVARHTAASLDVYMMGFMPGFPYMAKLPPELQVPRLDSPRVRVPIRSVSIAAEICVVYALETPGGLSLIGRTPVPFFDLGRAPPVLMESGDQVRFEAISLADYDLLEGDYAAHRKTLNFTWVDVA